MFTVPTVPQAVRTESECTRADLVQKRFQQAFLKLSTLTPAICRGHQQHKQRLKEWVCQPRYTYTKKKMFWQSSEETVMLYRAFTAYNQNLAAVLATQSNIPKTSASDMPITVRLAIPQLFIQGMSPASTRHDASFSSGTHGDAKTVMAGTALIKMFIHWYAC